MTSDCTGYFCINYSIQYFLGKALLDSNLLDKVDSRKELAPSRNSRNVGLRKLKPKQKKSTNQKKIKQKNKKSRSVTIQLLTASRSVKTKFPECKKLGNV